MTDTFHSKHFNSIQALRGITALFVALEHVRFLNCGAFGVDIFFVISGFMVMFSTHKDTRHFLGKRFIRIYPLYALVTLGTYFLLLLFPGMFHLTKADPASLLKSLCFIPFEISPGIIQPLVRVGWTINYEVLLYVLFAIACRLSHRFRGLICSSFLALLMVLSHTLPVDHVILDFYGDYILLEFIFGMLLYYVMSKIYVPLSEKKWAVLPAYLSVPAIVVLFGVLAYTKQNVPLIPFGRAVYWGLPALVIVTLTFIIDTKLTMPKPFVYLGNISFSIFLLHYYPLMFIDRKIYNLEHFTPMAIPVTICGLLLVILIASVSYALIEKCLAKHLRKFFK